MARTFNGTVLSHLPKPAKTGRPGCNDRNTINGILFVLTTGCRRADMPDRYGSKSTAYLRFSELRQKGRINRKFFCRQIRPSLCTDLIGSDGILFHIHQLLPKRGGYDAAYIGYLQMSRNQMLYFLQEFLIRCAREVQNRYRQDLPLRGFLAWLRYGLRRTVARHEKKLWEPSRISPAWHASWCIGEYWDGSVMFFPSP